MFPNSGMAAIPLQSFALAGLSSSNPPVQREENWYLLLCEEAGADIHSSHTSPLEIYSWIPHSLYTQGRVSWSLFSLEKEKLKQVIKQVIKPLIWLTLAVHLLVKLHLFVYGVSGTQ